VSRPIDPSRYLDRRTLILGEINSGKTVLADRIMAALIGQGLAERMAVIDLAPEVLPELAARWGLEGLGGYLIPPPGEPILYLAAPLVPPRLSAKTEAEAVHLARQNLHLAEPLLEDWARSGRDILFINDLSLYLQAGRAEQLVQELAPAKTVVANAYFGRRLGRGQLSIRERAETEALTQLFDQVVKT